MYKHIFSLLLLTLNVPLQTGKCTPRGTCTPVWEPLVYSVDDIPLSWLLWKTENNLHLTVHVKLTLLTTPISTSYKFAYPYIKIHVYFWSTVV